MLKLQCGLEELRSLSIRCIITVKHIWNIKTL